MMASGVEKQRFSDFFCLIFSQFLHLWLISIARSHHKTTCQFSFPAHHFAHSSLFQLATSDNVCHCGNFK